MGNIVVLLCVMAFIVLLGVLPTVFIMGATGQDYRVVWRTIRGGRFGLKSAFGLLAVAALSMGLAAAFRVGNQGREFFCILVFMVPLALFLVTLAGLSLSELFDNRSTRSIVARRAEEDELTAYARDRHKTTQEELDGDTPCEETHDRENQATP